MWEDIMKFIMPVLQSALSGAITSAINPSTGAVASPQSGSGPSIRELIESKRVSRSGLQSGQQNPGEVTGQGGGSGFIPSSSAGVLGSGSANKPGGAGMNFSGGYTGVAPATPYAQSGFTTMGYPTQDQARMRRTLENNQQGFQGI